ncbi:hypothetical protein [Desulfitobacterium chlororespirans]|uniref:Uncharacterized protein n=1 Tax=Desulfitobacterium chlororespirans DSM 11544 TaxID=1121395 RepID=A0A1M7T6I2_9FIRM|nr:hypothetical protein [Desulfitobacterium chlororespirans]SHN66324.1 hypothetical protein SAMN02745215_01655 [Desulfitobacterium chlororespirans DSM 11544]
MQNKLKLIGIVVLASVIGLVAVNFGILKYQEYQQKNNIATLNYSWNEEGSTPEPSPSEKDEKGLEENKQEEIKQPEPPVTDTKNDKKPEDEYKPGPIILPSQPLNNNNDTSQNNGTSVKDDVVKENPSGQEKTPEQSPETPATPSTNKPSSNQNSNEKKPDSGSANSGSSEGQQAYTPPPQNSTPAVTPPSSKGLSFGESLQYTKAGQPALGAMQNESSYPIIADGSPYEGTIHPSDNLSQADIDRLIGYKYTNVVESNDIVEKPTGTYDQDASFKRVVDGYIENMGPHIERKLRTNEWEFTPAPTASYSARFASLYGKTIIRGKLKVRYSTSDNPFKLEPNTWYQGDAEIGLSTVAFFTNNAQDRIPRTILGSFVILSGWGKE